MGAVYRAEPPVATWESPDGGVLVLVYGRPLIRRTASRPAEAAEVGSSFLEHGVRGISSLDGSFSVVIFQRQARRLFVCTDRIGSIPVLHARGPGGIAFSPEAKALFGLVGIGPRIDREGALSFLNLGYPVGRRTVFEGVCQLPPGSYLEIDAGTAGVREGRYWDLRFAPNRRWRLADAVAALDDAMEEAHRAVVADDPPRSNLLLTGGYDSRMVLAYMASVDRPPAESLTWGVDETLPGSDPAIARQVSRRMGVPHRFLYYGAERWPERAAPWVRVGELSSDNFGNYATGPGFFGENGVEAETPLLIGDQMVGPGGFPATRSQAVSNITKVPPEGLLPELRSMMPPRVQREAGALFTESVRRVAAGCASGHPKDVQDYLFFHLYVVRWLLAPAYFREPMASPRRPMLLAPVVEVGLQLPRRYRVDKAVLVALLRKRFPDLAGVPIASAHSLVDWELEVRKPGALRELFQELLAWEAVERVSLAEWLDRRAYVGAVSRYFSEVPRPVRRAPSSVPRAMAWRRWLAGLPVIGGPVRGLEPLAKRLLGGEPAGSTGPVLRRMALLSLLQRMIDDGSLCGTGEEREASVALRRERGAW